MPLIKSKSNKAVGANIKAEEKAGKPYKQSLAIALSTQDRAKKRKYDSGGFVEAQDISRKAFKTPDKPKEEVLVPTPDPVVQRKPSSGPQESETMQMYHNYDGGGQVQDPVQSAQDSMRKAFKFAEGGAVPYRSNSQDARNSDNESMIDKLMARRKQKLGPDLGDQSNEDENYSYKDNLMSPEQEKDYSIEGVFYDGGMVDMLRHGDSEDPIGKRTEFKPGTDENSAYDNKTSSPEQSEDNAKHAKGNEKRASSSEYPTSNDEVSTYAAGGSVEDARHGDNNDPRALSSEYPVGHDEDSSYASGGEVNDVRHLGNPPRYNYDYPVSKDEDHKYAMGGSVDNARHGAEDMTGIERDTDSSITHDEDSSIAYSKGGNVDNQNPPHNPKSFEVERYAGGGEAVHDYDDSDPRKMFAERRKKLLKKAMSEQS